MTGQSGHLVSIATSRFGPLFEREVEILTDAEAAQFPTGDVDATAKNRERPLGTVRAGLLRWLCVANSASRRVDPRGVRVKEALVDDELDLDSIRIPFPVAFENCEFAGAIRLVDAESRTLVFENSKLVTIVGDRLMCRGGIRLTKCTAREEVRLVGATIVGDLAFGASRFNGLSLVAVDVRGTVFLDDGFICRGTVRLTTSHIHGDLVCRNALFTPLKHVVTEVPATGAESNGSADADATLDAPDNEALDAASVHVGGDVFFDTGFRAEGCVFFQRAKIAGSLQCDGGTIQNPGGVALAGIFASVGNEIRMGNGFVADGEVDFNSARVQGQFNCEEGRFLNPGGTALNLDGAQIEGLVVLREVLVVGELRFVGSRLESSLDCTNATLVNREGRALFADRARIAGSVDFTSCSVAGQLYFNFSTVGNQLVFSGARLLCRGREALRAQGLTVQGSILFIDGCRIFGELDLSYSRINLGLECSQSRFSNRSGTALCLHGATIVGTMQLLAATYRGNIACESLRVEGDVRVSDVQFDNKEPGEGQEQPLVSFAGASVRDQFEWRAVSLSKATVVTFEGASVGALLDEVESWPAAGRLNLRGFHYENLAEIEPLPELRLRWLRRQAPERFSVQPYGELIAWARRVGRERDAMVFAIAREEARRMNGQLGVVQSAWSRFVGITLAHGYRPLRVVYAAILFVLIGWGIFGYGSAHTAMVPSKLEASAAGAANPAFSPLMYSLDTFLPIIDFYQESYWLPNTHTALGLWIMRYVWFHIAMGWAVSTLAVLGFSGFVRRE
jgi:hypothetical protein